MEGKTQSSLSEYVDVIYGFLCTVTCLITTFEDSAFGSLPCRGMGPAVLRRKQAILVFGSLRTQLLAFQKPGTEGKRVKALCLIGFRRISRKEQPKLEKILTAFGTSSSWAKYLPEKCKCISNIGMWQIEHQIITSLFTTKIKYK